MIGRQFGPYTIVAPLGAGGMGEVYRARDSKLGRDVAIKILPSHFTADAERRSRFAREARLLATLNHPHIGAIYGLEETDGVTALVLELVEGSTLADRLTRGPLPISEAIAIARQIAEALDSAHEKGIVHRDLKPTNIVLQSVANASGVPSGAARAKVLDFGLAKTMAFGAEGDLTHRASGTLDATAEGRILGTPAYMSPEQARGQAVDKRTDIWAFGCVLYEMLSGRRAFPGDTMSDTLVRILEREPDWTALPAATPAAVRTLLDRCLRKDPANRLHDIADARIELDDGTRPIATGSAPGVKPGVLDRSRQRLGWIVAAALALTLAGTILLNSRRVWPVAPQLVEFSIPAPEGWSFTGPSTQFAVSPDGQHVAFVATSRVGSSIWVRSLAAVEPRELPRTEGARNPFWSPDSQSIGFFANDQLKKVRASGGSPDVLCAAPGTTGRLAAAGTWNSDDVIVFGPFDDGHLFRISAKNPGTPTPVTTQETPGTHRWPWLLPDGQHFLFSAVAQTTSELRVGSLTAPGSAVIGTFDSPAAYAAGYLFFLNRDSLMSQSFNDKTRKLEGKPVPLGVQVGPSFFGPSFSVSATGRLVSLSPSGSTSQLTWLDRITGRPVGIVGDQGISYNLDLSPDGQRVAVDKLTPRPGGVPGFDIWVMDLATGRATRVTDDPANDFDPAWSPDGKHIVFNSARLGGWSLFMHSSDGSGGDVPVLKSGTDRDTYAVASWSRANDLVFNVLSKNNPGGDLWTLSMVGDRTPKAYVNSKSREAHGTFSPDGRWVAYQSNASGRSEIVVRPFPSKDPAQPVSRDGGTHPRWRGDGKELFLLSREGTMMAVGFDATNGVPEGVPRALFPTQLRPEVRVSRPYAVTKNGDRFLLPIFADAPLRAVLDWRTLLNR